MGMKISHAMQCSAVLPLRQNDSAELNKSNSIEFCSIAFKYSKYVQYDQGVQCMMYIKYVQHVQCGATYAYVRTIMLGREARETCGSAQVSRSQISSLSTTSCEQVQIK